MDEKDMLAERFEAYRPRLRAVAFQALGSPSEADDAVQETWLRLSRARPGAIENLGGWLTTVVARMCLNMLAARRDEPVGVHLPESAAGPDNGGPEARRCWPTPSALRSWSSFTRWRPPNGSPFVLHDIFAVPFDDIAAIFGRSPAEPVSWPAAPGAGSRAALQTRALTWPGREQSLTRSSPPPATGTSTHCWKPSIQTPSCAPTAPR